MIAVFCISPDEISMVKLINCPDVNGHKEKLAAGSYQFAVKNKITKSRWLCSTIYGFALLLPTAN